MWGSSSLRQARSSVASLSRSITARLVTILSGELRPEAPANSASTTAAVLASADHDQQIWRRPHVKYGEAVGIRPGQQIEPPRLASLASLLRNIACSVSLSGRMAAPMIDLVARSLRQ